MAETITREQLFAQLSQILDERADSIRYTIEIDIGGLGPSGPAGGWVSQIRVTDAVGLGFVLIGWRDAK